MSGRQAVGTNDWEHAYQEYPRFAVTFAWTHVIDVLEKHPGERVYEVGFGSGLNLLWAAERGWEVAGCEIATTPLEIARNMLPNADLRLESIIDCTAPSEYYDVVIDRAALTYFTPKELKRAFAHVRRILRPGGVFFFNPYGSLQTRAFPDVMPTATLWDDRAARRLFPDTKWEMLDFQNYCVRFDEEPGRPIEHTLRILARKPADATTA